MEGRLSLTDGESAAVVSLTAKWDPEGVLGWAVALSGKGRDICTVKTMDGDPLEGESVFPASE